MSDLKWMNNVDLSQFSEEVQVAYSEYKDIQRKAAAAREVFETAFKGEFTLPQGYTVVFGYRFGQLSVGVGQGEAKVKAKVEPRVSLQDWINSQTSSGHSV